MDTSQNLKNFVSPKVSLRKSKGFKYVKGLEVYEIKYGKEY